MSDSSPSIISLRSCGLGSNPPCPPFDQDPCGHSECEVRDLGDEMRLVCIDTTDCAENCECRQRVVTQTDLDLWNVTTNQRFMLACEEIDLERSAS